MASFLRINHRFWPVFTALVLLALSVMSLLPSTVAMPEPVSSDKLHHVVAYTAVALPVALARPRGWVLLMVAFALWGIAIELVQPLVGRTRAAADVAANLGGLALAVAASSLLRALARSPAAGVGPVRSTGPGVSRRARGTSAHGQR